MIEIVFLVMSVCPMRSYYYEYLKYNNYYERLISGQQQDFICSVDRCRFRNLGKAEVVWNESINNYFE